MSTLEDIQQRLRANQYEREEHVRLAIVARLLQEYGWDIWNPTEVNTEYVPVPNEDKKKVDVALFLPPSTPAVFIEVKPVGGITNLPDTERQLRDYNRNITATFCIITDGREWRFYYSLTPGDFSSKCFRVVDLLKDDTQDIQRTFALFLDKDQLQSPEARRHAEELLRLSRKERVLQESLPEARRAVQQPPFPTLPQALSNVAKQRGIVVSQEEAVAFIEKAGTTKPPPPAIVRQVPSGGKDFDPEKPPDLARTTITSASIGARNANKWNVLVGEGLRIALEREDFDQVRSWIKANIRSGKHKDKGFRPLRGTNISMQYMQTTRAWEVAFHIAKRLRVPIEVNFAWRDHPEASHPGQHGTLRWSP